MKCFFRAESVFFLGKSLMNCAIALTALPYYYEGNTNREHYFSDAWISTVIVSACSVSNRLCFGGDFCYYKSMVWVGSRIVCKKKS